MRQSPHDQLGCLHLHGFLQTNTHCPLKYFLCKILCNVQFYISEDRLYYTGDEKNATRARYICLDRVPVRPLPHSRVPRKGWVGTVPDIGIALVDPV